MVPLPSTLRDTPQLVKEIDLRTQPTGAWAIAGHKSSGPFWFGHKARPESPRTLMFLHT